MIVGGRPGTTATTIQSSAAAVLSDLARDLTDYCEGIEFNPRRLEEVEERLHLIHGLQRKYGDTCGIPCD